MTAKRHIAILGSTGSIGTQALDVIRHHRDLFQVDLVSAHRNVDLLCAQAREFDAAFAVICDESLYCETAARLSDASVQVFAGSKSLEDLVSSPGTDIVLASMVGFSGLAPTLAALRAGKVVALANKETLVAAGDLVKETARQGGGAIIPVDSEHSAIFQCLLAAQGNELKRILLTASGGPFRTWSRERIAGADVTEALHHPRWKMGAKVTIDSATMMNKGFELIEACHLFDVTPDKVKILVHPESVVHSMVEFADGAIIAQLGNPDMRQPIGFALGFPQRLPFGGTSLDLEALGELHFASPDTERFPNLALAAEAFGKGGNTPCALNAADEVAVQAYLDGKTTFYGMTSLICKCIEETPFVANPSLQDIFDTHKSTVELAKSLL